MLLLPVIAVGALLAGFAGTAITSQLAEGRGPVLLVGLAVAPLLLLAALARPWLAVAYVFLSIPVGSTGIPRLSMQVVQGMILVAAAVLFLRCAAEGRFPLDWSQPLSWFAAFFLWAVVALPSASNQGIAVRQTVLFGVELLFATVIVTVCRSAAEVRRVLAPLLIVAAGIAVITPIGWTAPETAYGGALVTGRAQGVFHQPNELGTFCAVAIFVAVGMALGGATRRARRTAALGGALLLLPLLLSLSRGAWIGVSFGLVALVVMLPEKRKLLLKLFAPVALVAIALILVVPSSEEVQVVGERARSIVGERNPYDDRPHIWAEGRRQLLADQWTGQGPGSFKATAARSGSGDVVFYPQHAHNLLLNFAAEMGLPAVVLALGLFVSVANLTRRGLRRARESSRPRDAALLAGLAAAMVAVVAQGIIDYPLRSSVIFTTVTGVLGALLALAEVLNRR